MCIYNSNHFRISSVSDRRMALNIIAMYGHSLYALVNGLDVDDGAREITD